MLDGLFSRDAWRFGLARDLVPSGLVGVGVGGSWISRRWWS